MFQNNQPRAATTEPMRFGAHVAQLERLHATTTEPKNQTRVNVLQGKIPYDAKITGAATKTQCNQMNNSF